MNGDMASQALEGACDTFHTRCLVPWNCYLGTHERSAGLYLWSAGIRSVRHILRGILFLRQATWVVVATVALACVYGTPLASYKQEHT